MADAEQEKTAQEREEEEQKAQTEKELDKMTELLEKAGMPGGKESAKGWINSSITVLKALHATKSETEPYAVNSLNHIKEAWWILESLVEES